MLCMTPSPTPKEATMTTKYDRAVDALAATIEARLAFDEAQDRVDAAEVPTTEMRADVTRTYADWYGKLTAAHEAQAPLSPQGRSRALSEATQRFIAVA